MSADAEGLSAAGLVAQGRTRHLKGDLASARQLYDRAFGLDPDNFDANFLLGHALRQDGQPRAALTPLIRAAQLMPLHPFVWTCQAQAWFDLECFDEALQACDQALQLRPDDAQAHFNRGTALVMMKRHDEALASFDRALALAPGHIQAHHNKIQTLVRIDEAAGGSAALAQALQAAHRLLALQPDDLDTRLLCATLHEFMGEYEAAIALYQDVASNDPDQHKAHYGLATCWLSVGDWTRGWDRFESRIHLQSWATPALPGTPEPWRGQALAGKSILLIAEGGLGDTLNFFRYAQIIAEMGAHVSTALQSELRDLLVPGATAAAAAAGEQAPRCDYYCHFMSLPMVFGARPDNVPKAKGYIQADTVKTALWHRRLGPARGLRVGLVWSGNPEHLNDHNRSMPLSTLSCLLQEPGIEFCCLQKIIRTRDQDTLAGHPQLAVFGDELRDFGDTAALCNAMDLIITVDTSTAHLAGAMGKPVWIMLPCAAEYRWMAHREDTPWYASARLFRQPRRGDWAPVIARIQSEIRQLLAAQD